MTRHRYPRNVLSADYVRAAVGLAFTAGPVLTLQPAPAVAAILGSLAALFAAFALRTGLRHFTVIEVTPDAIAARGPLPCRLPWREITRLRLDYFSTRRQREQGWMQLKVSGGFRRIRVDSTIDGFEELANVVAGIARENGIPMADTAVANFRALGIEVAGADREIAA